MVETRRRRQIEDVASELFREQGYAATSVRDIAKALDIRGASLYSHVTSKQDVLWSILDRAARTFELGADRAEAATREAGPAARLAALVRSHAEVETADPEEASVFDREWRHLAGPRREAILARRDAYEARFRTAIQDGIDTGAFAPADPAIAAAFILTALNGISDWYRAGGPRSPAEIADAYATIALRALMETSG
jgi:AcrR family transcriptional regulator